MKKLLGLVACLALVCLLPLQALAFNVTLAWEASQSPDVSEYIVNWGPESGVYTDAASMGNNLTGQITGLTNGAMYYFAVSCRDIEGLHSDFSNEVFTDGVSIIPDGTPPLSPGGCIITSITP